MALMDMATAVAWAAAVVCVAAPVSRVMLNRFPVRDSILALASHHTTPARHFAVAFHFTLQWQDRVARM